MKVQIAKWGNSAAVRLPKAVLDALGLELGETLDIAVDGRTLLLSPTRRRVTVDEIVAEMRRLGVSAEPPAVDWGPDVGTEIINDDYSSVMPEDGGPDDRGKPS